MPEIPVLKQFNITRKAIANLAFGLIVVIPLCICGGCLMEPGDSSSTQNQPPTSTDQPTALRDNSPTGRPDDPVGCFREWDGAVQDSVLNCPDIRPPKMK